MSERFDLAVIGGGPAGYTAAIEAAKLGMKTVLAEKRDLGGTCLNRGCIPTKTILHSAQIFAQIRNAEDFGVSAERASYDPERIQQRKMEVIRTLREGIAGLMKQNRVTVLHGSAVIADEHRILLDEGEEITAENILIAAGSETVMPPIPGAELACTSEGLLDDADKHQCLIIVGGGVIGMEFASIYSALGCRVTVIEFLDRILSGFDREISQNLKMIMKKRGAEIHTGSRVDSIAKQEDGRLICRYTEKEKEKEAVADSILIATGRRPNIEGIFAAGFGVGTESGYILTDDDGRTSVANIYAAGDVRGGAMLAHAAAAQAVNAVRHMAGKKKIYDLGAVPGCVYTDPEIGTVGLTADEAKGKGLEIITRKYPMSANGKTVLTAQDRSFIKVVAEKDTHVILGAQMMCARATDMISQFAAAVVNRLTLEQLAAVVYPHPTFSEAIGEAVR